MPRKKREATASTTQIELGAFWKSRIEDARKERDRVGEEWESVRRELLGQNFVADEFNLGMAIDVSLAHSYLQTLIPKVVLQNPKLTGEARRKGSEMAAKLMAQVDNYFLDELKMVPEFRLGVADTGAYAMGVVKAGYIPPGKDYPELEEPEAKDAIAEAEAEIDELAGEEPTEGEKPVADPAALIDPMKKRGSFFVEHVPVQNFLWDGKITNPRHCRWMGDECVMPVSAIKKDVRYDEKARNKVQGTMQDADTRRRGNRRGGPVVDSPVGRREDVMVAAGGPGKKKGHDQDEGYDRIIEIWDWEGQMLYTFAESVTEPLQAVKWPYPTEGPPYSILRFNITPGEFVPRSDIAAALPQIQEIKYVRRMRAIHLRRFNRKYSVDAAVYEDEESIQSLEEGGDGTLVKATPGQIEPIQDAATSPDYDRHLIDCKTDFREITAQSELERGSAENVDTATVGAILDRNANLRSNYLRSLTEAWIGETFRILNQLIKAFMPGSRAVQITGDPDAEDGWREITRADLQGEYDIKVIAGSTLPGSEVAKQEQLVKLKNIVQPEFSAGLLNPIPILRELLEAYGIKDIEAVLNIMPSAPDSTAPGAQPDLLAALMGNGASGMGGGGGPDQPMDAISAAMGKLGGRTGGRS